MRSNEQTMETNMQNISGAACTPPISCPSQTLQCLEHMNSNNVPPSWVAPHHLTIFRYDLHDLMNNHSHQTFKSLHLTCLATSPSSIHDFHSEDISRRPYASRPASDVQPILDDLVDVTSRVCARACIGPPWLPNPMFAPAVQCSTSTKLYSYSKRRSPPCLQIRRSACLTSRHTTCVTSCSRTHTYIHTHTHTVQADGPYIAVRARARANARVSCARRVLGAIGMLQAFTRYSSPEQSPRGACQALSCESGMRYYCTGGYGFSKLTLCQPGYELYWLVVSICACRWLDSGWAVKWQRQV